MFILSAHNDRVTPHSVRTGLALNVEACKMKFKDLPMRCRPAITRRCRFQACRWKSNATVSNAWLSVTPAGNGWTFSVANSCRAFWESFLPPHEVFPDEAIISLSFQRGLFPIEPMATPTSVSKQHACRFQWGEHLIRLTPHGTVEAI